VPVINRPQTPVVDGVGDVLCIPALGGVDSDALVTVGHEVVVDDPVVGWLGHAVRAGVRQERTAHRIVGIWVGAALDVQALVDHVLQRAVRAHGETSDGDLRMPVVVAVHAAVRQVCRCVLAAPAGPVRNRRRGGVRPIGVTDQQDELRRCGRAPQARDVVLDHRPAGPRRHRVDRHLVALGPLGRHELGQRRAAVIGAGGDDQVVSGALG